MQGCEGSLAFCLPPKPAQSTTTTAASAPFSMGSSESVSDSSTSFLNVHPVYFGLSTTGMMLGVVFVLFICWCFLRHGGKKMLDKIRAPRGGQPDIVASNQEQQIQFVPPRSWANPSFMPQGSMAPAYSPPVAASMPLLATASSGLPLYENLDKISSQLDKMSLQDSLPKSVPHHG